MIKFNDQFSIEGVPNNWVLHDTYVGKNKKGEQMLHTKESYHGSLKQIASAIIDRLIAQNEEVKTLEELINAVKKTEVRVTEWLEHLEKNRAFYNDRTKTD